MPVARQVVLTFEFEATNAVAGLDAPGADRELGSVGAPGIVVPATAALVAPTVPSLTVPDIPEL